MPYLSAEEEYVHDTRRQKVFEKMMGKKRQQAWSS